MKKLQEKLELLQQKVEEGKEVKVVEIRYLYFEIKTWLEINPDETIGRMKTKSLVNALKLWAKLSIEDKEEALFVKKEAREQISVFMKKEGDGYLSHASKIIYNILPILEQKPAET